MTLLDRQRIHHLLKELDAACAKDAITADVFLVGGAAMCLAYDSERSTRDLDGLFEPTTALREVIAKIGEREDLESDWFNDAAKGFIVAEDPDATEVYVSPNLRVTVASPEYLLAMKLLSARESDVDDALVLARLAGKMTEEDLLSTLTGQYPPSMLQVKNRYFAADIAGLLATEETSSAPALGPAPQAQSWPPGDPIFHSQSRNGGYGDTGSPQSPSGPRY